MLVTFTVENWRSYRDETTLSMIADRNRQHVQSLAMPKYYKGLRILPIAAVYGGNAAGKSNLFDALRFVKWFVSTSAPERKNIPTQPFENGETQLELSAKAVSFSIQMLVQQPCLDEYIPTRTKQKELIYQLDFTVNRYKVLEESLSWYDSLRQEHIIYVRDNTGITFSEEFKNKIDIDTYQKLRVYGQGTGEKRLFLTNTVDQQLPTFRHVFEWFYSNLRTADNGMQTPYMETLMGNEDYCKQISHVLHALGTGVEEVRLENVEPSAAPKDVIDSFRDIIEHTPDNVTGQFISRTGADITQKIYTISKKDGIATIKRVQTYRNGQPFGFDRESSGTRRLVEIFPIFLDLWSHNPCVWVLDEIEREFHTDMSVRLLQEFLETCSADTRTQAFINTHDLMLMDQALFRKDEIFIVEKDKEGASSLESVGEYEGIRNDLDLRRSYLDGRFGGRPSIDRNALSKAIHGK